MVANCHDLRNGVAVCLQRSPCVMLDRNRPKDCLDKPELFKQLPEDCVILFRKYMECKMGAIDMRKRFRGNGPHSTGKYDKELSDLSSGDFDVEEELRILGGGK